MLKMVTKAYDDEIIAEVYEEISYHHNKRYLIIDQQIARHFVQYSEYLSHSLPFYPTQMINPILNLRISANHNKG